MAFQPTGDQGQGLRIIPRIVELWNVSQFRHQLVNIRVQIVYHVTS